MKKLPTSAQLTLTKTTVARFVKTQQTSSFSSLDCSSAVLTSSLI